jgi:hypothetical protein
MKIFVDFWKQSKFFLLWVVGGFLVLLAGAPKQDPIPSASQNLIGSDPSMPMVSEGSDPSIGQLAEPTVQPPMVQQPPEQAVYFSAQEQEQAGGLQIDCSVDPSVSGLNLRVAPNAAITSIIPCDASGIVLTGDRTEAGGVNWVRVSYGDRTGWVAEAFLK